VGDDAEFTVPPGTESVLVAQLTPDEPRARTRGAAHEAFDLVFALPFDEAAVDGYREPPPPPDPAEAPPAPLPPARKRIGIGALGVGAAGLAVGTSFAIASLAESKGGGGESQVDAAARNRRIDHDRTVSAIGFTAGGVLLVTGLAVLLWPRAPRGVPVSIAIRPGGGALGYGAAF
jgi:hypothetical protein